MPCTPPGYYKPHVRPQGSVVFKIKGNYYLLPDADTGRQVGNPGEKVFRIGGTFQLTDDVYELTESTPRVNAYGVWRRHEFDGGKFFCFHAGEQVPDDAVIVVRQEEDLNGPLTYWVRVYFEVPNFGPNRCVYQEVDRDGVAIDNFFSKPGGMEHTGYLTIYANLLHPTV